jgi:hypothetical protein
MASACPLLTRASLVLARRSLLGGRGFSRSVAFWRTSFGLAGSVWIANSSGVRALSSGYRSLVLLSQGPLTLFLGWGVCGRFAGPSCEGCCEVLPRLALAASCLAVYSSVNSSLSLLVYSSKMFCSSSLLDSVSWNSVVGSSFCWTKCFWSYVLGSLITEVSLLSNPLYGRSIILLTF